MQATLPIRNGLVFELNPMEIYASTHTSKDVHSINYHHDSLLLLNSCAGVETRLGLHSAVLNDLQPELQQMWQEQLDRVRRQQIIYREKVGGCR